MESEIMEWKKFLMLSLESSFWESCTISWRELREEILMHKESTIEKQALWGRISGVISLWKEKVESDYFYVEIFYIGRKNKPVTKVGTPQPCWQGQNRIKWRKKSQSWINSALKISQIKTVRHHIREAKWMHPYGLEYLSKHSDFNKKNILIQFLIWILGICLHCYWFSLIVRIWLFFISSFWSSKKEEKDLHATLSPTSTSTHQVIAIIKPANLQFIEPHKYLV